MTASAIAAYVIAEKKLDGKDKRLRLAISYKVIQIVRRWNLARKVTRVKKVGTAIVWRLAHANRHQSAPSRLFPIAIDLSKEHIFAGLIVHLIKCL